MKDYSIYSKEVLNQMNPNTLMESLGIEFLSGGLDTLEARMPVDTRTHQPMGLLHGGASAALIESIGSLGSALLCDLSKEYPVGLEVNANHIGGLTSGFVVGYGKLIHHGKKTHVWQVDIKEETSDRLICSGRLTVMVVSKKKEE